LDPITVVEVGISLAESLIASFTKAKVPQEILDSLQAAIDVLNQHKSDLVTKANLEAQRGV